MRNTVQRAVSMPIPSVPPRTYPALPPSRLPNLIAGILRLFSLLLGGAGVIVLLYSV